MSFQYVPIFQYYLYITDCESNIYIVLLGTGVIQDSYVLYVKL